MNEVPAVATDGLGKRYRRRWALRSCTLDLPQRRVVGLVGANGAGKSTLLHAIVGLLTPTEGSISVLGEAPAASPAQLARVGFVAQDVPLYRTLTIADHMRAVSTRNSRWDPALADGRLRNLGLDPSRKVGQLSGGERAQVALTLALAKRPQLLVLDEPVASLDPLARREFLQGLMEAVVDQELTVILSSHLLADVERVCDHVVVVNGGRVSIAGDVDDLLGEHVYLTGPGHELERLASAENVVRCDSAGRQTTLLLRTRDVRHAPHWSMSEVGLEELVLAYLGRPPEGPGTAP